MADTNYHAFHELAAKALIQALHQCDENHARQYRRSIVVALNAMNDALYAAANKLSNQIQELHKAGSAHHSAKAMSR